MGDVIIVRGNESNGGKWSLGVIVDLFEGRDGVVRALNFVQGSHSLKGLCSTFSH